VQTVTLQPKIYSQSDASP